MVARVLGLFRNYLGFRGVHDTYIQAGPCINGAQEWFNVSRDALASGHEEVSADPFKSGEPSPLRRLETIGDDATTIRVDPAHTYAIKGWGEDFCGSSLILLVRLNILQGRSLQSALDHGFALFKEYCQRRRKSTSITHFDLQTLRVTSHFGAQYDVKVL